MPIICEQSVLSLGTLVGSVKELTVLPENVFPSEYKEDIEAMPSESVGGGQVIHERDDDALEVRLYEIDNF